MQVNPVPADASGPSLDRADLEKLIHDLINAERKRAGLSLLSRNDQLVAIARAHSTDMAARDYFDHADPDGREFPERYRSRGFDCRISCGEATICLGAENIAMEYLLHARRLVNGRTIAERKSSAEIARSVVRLWMRSSGHRENILTPSYRTHGIGVAIDRNGRIFVTQNFC